MSHDLAPPAPGRCTRTLLTHEAHALADATLDRRRSAALLFAFRRLDVRANHEHIPEEAPLRPHRLSQEDGFDRAARAAAAPSLRRQRIRVNGGREQLADFGRARVGGEGEEVRFVDGLVTHRRYGEVLAVRVGR